MDGLVIKEPLRGYSVTPMLDAKTSATSMTCAGC